MDAELYKLQALARLLNITLEEAKKLAANPAAMKDYRGKTMSDTLRFKVTPDVQPAQANQSMQGDQRLVQLIDKLATLDKATADRILDAALGAAQKFAGEQQAGQQQATKAQPTATDVLWPW